jgi:LruC domain-containing protein
MIYIYPLLFLLLSSGLKAAPFATCPSKAFLVQQSVATLSGVNLVSGNTLNLSEDMGTTDKLNAVGFSIHDQYLYGWSYEYQTLARIGQNYQVEPLAVSHAPLTSFFVGDVSSQENTYFAYRKGASFGLYGISLDSDSPNYLQAIRIADDSNLNLNIFDFAFHPDSHEVYSVDRSGQLLRIDIHNASVETLGHVGVTGTFGAVYFDASGTLYISRNDDGQIFRVDPDAAAPQAELFASGPASSNNDGARCAAAPLIDEDDTSMDYGDAPASYGTALADNGPRHQIVEGGLYLGDTIDGEFNAQSYPASDDASGNQDDEDGIALLSPLERGQDALLRVTSSGEGYFQAWIDWDLSGSFDDTEQLISDHWLSGGDNLILIAVPNNAQASDTWLRVRLSHDAGLGPLGGTVDGEIEDYPVTITDQGVYAQHYPSANSWLTLAFEDNWPELGDYDANDVVVGLRITRFRTQSSISQYRIEGRVNAVGASYHNGFAIRLPGISPSQIDTDSLYLELDGEPQSHTVLEPGRQEAIIIISDDLWDLIPANDACRYFRTESNCTQQGMISFKVVINLSEDLEVDLTPEPPFDPFIFAAPGTYHGDLLGQPGRGWEVHLKNQAPTEAFNRDYFGLAADYSDPSNGHYYLTENGLPWALSMGSHWLHPLEYKDLLQAYPEFQGFVESEGELSRDWYAPNKRISSNTVNF